MNFKVAVLDNIHLMDQQKDKLKKLCWEKLNFPEDNEVAEEKLIKRTGQAEAILVSPWAKITTSFLNSCPSIKYVGLCGTSATNIDLESLKKKGITFSNIKDYSDEAAAEYMFMLLLKFARGDGKCQWKENPRELMGKRIGIIGLGALGKSFAYLAQGFKMETYYHSLHRKSDWEKKGVKYLNKENLLQECEVIVISTPSDVKVLASKDFKKIKPGSVLIYASGGEALDENAFIKWLDYGNFALFNYSTSDRYYSMFKDHPNIVFPKVVAGYTQETKERLGERVIENLLDNMG